jgi:hypothetical protein
MVVRTTLTPPEPADGSIPKRAKVFVQARSVFAKVPPAMWARAMAARNRGPDDVDWGGGDPSNFLRWQLKGGLQYVLRPALMRAEVRVRLEVTDANPSVWSITAGPGGFAARPEQTPDWQVSFSGPFKQWVRLIRGSASLAALEEQDDVSIDGDRAALSALTTGLDFGRFS